MGLQCNDTTAGCAPSGAVTKHLDVHDGSKLTKHTPDFQFRNSIRSLAEKELSIRLLWGFLCRKEVGSVWQFGDTVDTVFVLQAPQTTRQYICDSTWRCSVHESLPASEGSNVWWCIDCEQDGPTKCVKFSAASPPTALQCFTSITNTCAMLGARSQASTHPPQDHIPFFMLFRCLYTPVVVHWP